MVKLPATQGIWDLQKQTKGITFPYAKSIWENLSKRPRRKTKVRGYFAGDTFFSYNR